MAEIRPLRALHYDPAVVGSIANVLAPPYDVIDAGQRAELAGRSPYNVVELDLPQGQDPYAAAGERFAQWQQAGVLARDHAGAFWAHEQDYTGPDGVRRTRRGFFCAVRITDYGPGRIRPHERTHPGPKEDRLRLTRATGANLSPIFSLYSDPRQSAWQAMEPYTAVDPWAAATDDDGTVHRIWRIDDQAALEAVIAAAAGSELLIADGHHRYETAQAYAREIDASGADSDGHHWVLMCLVALEDPGLTVFPTHRLVANLNAERAARLAEALERDFKRRPSSIEELTELAFAEPEGPLRFGYISERGERIELLSIAEQGIADRALPGSSEAYRRLDTGVLEALLLKGALAMTDEDISHLHGFGYARHPRHAQQLLAEGSFDAAFIMRPTPVEQIKQVAAAGENMPPKSTYFFPKLLTGLLFNPLD